MEGHLVNNPSDKDIGRVSCEYAVLHVCLCIRTYICLAPSTTLQVTVRAQYRSSMQGGPSRTLELWIILVIVACIVVFILLLGVTIVVLYCVSA